MKVIETLYAEYKELSIQQAEKLYADIKNAQKPGWFGEKSIGETDV